MSSQAPTRLPALLYVALGAALAAVLILTVRPGTIPLGPATARFSLEPSGALGFSPGAPASLLVADERPGGVAQLAHFRVRNETSAPLRIRFGARVSSPVLDRALRVRLSLADGRVLLEGLLQSLLFDRSPTFKLAPGRSQAVTLGTWIPAQAGRGYAGQDVDIALSADIAHGG